MLGERKLYILRKLPSDVQDIAWQAQTRLPARYRKLDGHGKNETVITTAIAREMAAFRLKLIHWINFSTAQLWDIAQHMMLAA